MHHALCMEFRQALTLVSVSPQVIRGPSHEGDSITRLRRVCNILVRPDKVGVVHGASHTAFAFAIFLGATRFTIVHMRRYI